jgi:hypothetical protein
VPNDDVTGSHSAGRSDWSKPLERLSRLAVARETARREIGAATSQESAVPIDTDQLARAIAQIRQASAAVRRSEAALELVWRPIQTVPGKTRPRQSVWMLIGAIWISAGLFLAATASSIFYLLG